MHLSKIFKLNPCEITLEEEYKLLSDNTTSITLDIPTRLFTIKEAVIKNLNPKKALGYDLTTNQILQKLPEMRIKYIIQLCNAVLK
jgi:hypothetical protein